jgi:hypothetical protein
VVATEILWRVVFNADVEGLLDDALDSHASPLRLGERLTSQAPLSFLTISVTPACIGHFKFTVAALERMVRDFREKKTGRSPGSYQIIIPAILNADGQSQSPMIAYQLW